MATRSLENQSLLYETVIVMASVFCVVEFLCCFVLLQVVGGRGAMEISILMKKALRRRKTLQVKVKVGIKNENIVMVLTTVVQYIVKYWGKWKV